MNQAQTTTVKEKNKRVVLNIAANLSYQLIIVVFGLILPRLYLVNFGSDVNGLDNTIRNIFAYLALLEAGVSLSAQYALYAPVSQGKTDEINAILAATRKFYLRSGVIYTAVTILFAFVYPLIVKTSVNYFTVCALILLYGIPGIVSFLLRGKYNAFLEVDGKRYIITNLMTITLIISNILRLVLLLFSDNLILVQVTYCLPSLIQMVFIMIYVKKHYPWINWHVKPNLESMAQKGSVLVHQISACIFSNTDTIIISIMCGMNYASVYAVYSLFFANFQRIITSFTNSLTFKFGQLYQMDRERFYKEFSAYETIYYTLMFISYTVITAFLMPVIRLYTKGVADAAIYDSTSILLTFSISTILSAVEVPLTQLLYVAGRFDETRNQAVWEMIINIVVSLAATWKFGLVGCLIGTTAALFYRINALIIFSSKNIMNRHSFHTYKKVILNMVLFVAVLLVIGTESGRGDNYFYVALDAAVNAVWITLLFAAVNFITNRTECMNMFGVLKKMVCKR